MGGRWFFSFPTSALRPTLVPARYEPKLGKDGVNFRLREDGNVAPLREPVLDGDAPGGFLCRGRGLIHEVHYIRPQTGQFLVDLLSLALGVKGSPLA